MTHWKTHVVALAASALVLIAASTASARNLSLSEQSLRIVWTELVFENTVGWNITCPVTMEGSLHTRTIEKEIGTLLGYITAAAVGRGETCVGGEATILTDTLPWHITYQGFTGTLPAITAIRLRLRKFAMQIHAAGAFTCLARAEPAHPMNLIATLNAEGKITTLENEAGTLLPVTGEGGLCGFASGRFYEDPSTVTDLGGTELVIVRLI